MKTVQITEILEFYDWILLFAACDPNGGNYLCEAIDTVGGHDRYAVVGVRPERNVLATFAEFEADLSRMRTREGMVISRAKGKLRGKQPKLSDRKQRELCRMHATGEYSISELAELFSVSRPTVFHTLDRRLSP